MSSLLNMAAFRSRMPVLVACQFGSEVDAFALLKLIGICELASGDVGALDGGCVI